MGMRLMQYNEKYALLYIMTLARHFKYAYLNSITV
jgi:hypothetical protein